jgi:hypothetical protein
VLAAFMGIDLLFISSNIEENLAHTLIDTARLWMKQVLSPSAAPSEPPSILCVRARVAMFIITYGDSDAGILAAEILSTRTRRLQDT